MLRFGIGADNGANSTGERCLIDNLNIGGIQGSLLAGEIVEAFSLMIHWYKLSC